MPKKKNEAENKDKSEVNEIVEEQENAVLDDDYTEE